MGRRFAVVLFTLAACSESADERCQQLIEQARFGDAARLCLTQFRATRRPKDGVAAARALWELERDNEVLELVAKLDAGSEAAGARYLRGRILLDRGQSDAGYRELQAALLLDLVSNRHSDAARDLSVLADRLWKDGRYREGIACAEQMRAEATIAGDVGREVWAMVELGDLWSEIGDPVRASRAFSNAVASGAMLDATQGAAVQLKIARVELKRGHLAIARAELAKGLARAIMAGDTRLVVEARTNLADVAWGQGRLDEVAAQLAAARAAVPAGAVELPLTHAEARLAIANNQLDDALRALDAPQHVMPSWRWRFEHLRGRIAEAQGRLEDASAAYGRAVTIVEELRTELRAGDLEATFLDERRRAHQALLALAIRRGDANAAFGAMERLLARSFVDAFVAGNAGAPLERLEARPDLVRRLGRSPTAPLQRPAAEVLAAVRSVHVLVYVEAGDNMYCMVISGGRPRLVRLAPAPEEVRALVLRITASPDDAVAAVLGSALLPEEIGALPDGLLYVVPSGPVAGLPFALLLRNGTRLIDHHDLAMVPSVGVLARMLVAPEPKGGAAVVLGDPRGDLPGARAEAVRVARYLGVTPQVGTAATLSALSAASRASLLHVATHASIELGSARLTLANAAPSAAEILAAGVAARVTVLASCASAVTPLPEFWGSLAAAFLAAGSRSVVASLWSVNDLATAELVDTFYANGGAEAPAAALAIAQRHLALKFPPSTWAAFVVVGIAGSSKEAL